MLEKRISCCIVDSTKYFVNIFWKSFWSHLYVDIFKENKGMKICNKELIVTSSYTLKEWNFWKLISFGLLSQRQKMQIKKYHFWLWRHHDAINLL